MVLQKNTYIIPVPFLKRLFDIIFSLSLIIITLPLFVIILIGIFLEHIIIGEIRAGLFYKGKRISRGKFIPFYKFNIFKPKVIREMRERGEYVNTKRLEHDGHSLSIMGIIIQKV